MSEVEIVDEKARQRGRAMSRRGHYDKTDTDFTFDMMMVFESPKDVMDDPPEVAAPYIQLRLEKAGLKTRLFPSVSRKYVFLLIGASESRLEAQAQISGYNIKLNRDRAIQRGVDLDFALAKVTKERDEYSNMITTSLWEDIYVRFDSERRDLYEKYSHGKDHHQNSVFRVTDRIKLTTIVVGAPVEKGGAALSMGKLMKSGHSHLVAFFPLHKKQDKKKLKDEWLGWKSSFSQPIEKIRDYFGEEVGFYFAFLEFYNYWLAFLAFFGIIFFGVQSVDGITAARGVWFFSIIVCLWSTFMFEVWKRKESMYRVKWGMNKFRTSEHPRSDFSGVALRSPVTGLIERYFPFWSRVSRAMFTQTVVATLICIVVGLVAGVFILRSDVLTRDDALGDFWGRHVSSFLNVAVILIMNAVYGYVAESLNWYENHRTYSEHYNALILKTYMFKFVNSYSSLFYLAFFRQYERSESLGCEGSQCLIGLRDQLAILFGAMLVINNFVEIAWPLMLRYLQLSRGTTVTDDLMDEDEKKDAQDELMSARTYPEKQFEFAPYDSTIDDYDELAIQFGYVVLFATALPLTALLALVNNIVEIQIDGNKLIRLCRRPFPRGAYNIGTWYSIFTVTAFIGVLTNIMLAVIYSEDINDYVNGKEESKYMIVIISEHLLILLKLAFTYFIPNETHESKIHFEREKLIEDILINGTMPDDDASDLARVQTMKTMRDERPFFEMEGMLELERDSHNDF